MKQCSIDWEASTSETAYMHTKRITRLTATRKQSAELG